MRIDQKWSGSNWRNLNHVDLNSASTSSSVVNIFRLIDGIFYGNLPGKPFPVNLENFVDVPY